MDANFWVLATGLDCDGYNSGNIIPFGRSEDAEQYAFECNEWSDGIKYVVTDSLDVLRDYCNDYNRDWKKYLNE